MTFANFITIQYALMIERIPALATVFGNLWIFAIGFISLYIPLSIMIGYWHRRTQWKVEQEAMFNENIVQARLWLFLINLIDGKVTDQERQEMRERLQKIIKKLPHDLQQEKKPN